MRRSEATWAIHSSAWQHRDVTLLLTLLIMAVIGLVAAVAAGRIGGGLDDPASSLPGRGLPPGPFTLEDEVAELRAARAPGNASANGGYRPGDGWSEAYGDFRRPAPTVRDDDSAGER